MFLPFAKVVVTTVNRTRENLFFGLFYSQQVFDYLSRIVKKLTWEFLSKCGKFLPKSGKSFYEEKEGAAGLLVKCVLPSLYNDQGSTRRVAQVGQKYTIDRLQFFAAKMMVFRKWEKIPRSIFVPQKPAAQLSIWIIERLSAKMWHFL